MKTINLEQLKRLNFINENAAMPASGTILGVDDLPTKVSIMLEGKVLEIIPAFTGKSSVSCPLKPSESAPLKHSTMPP